MFSSRRKLIPLLLLALATALLAAACGSENEERTVPAGAIALVGGQEIPKEDLDRLVEQTKSNYEAQGQDFPDTGTPAYENIKSTLVRSLVQQAQWEQAGAEMGLKVSEQEIDTQLEELKKQYFKNDEDKYKAELEKQGITEEQLREQIEAKLLSDKIYAAVTKKATVTEQEINAYYEQNKAQYEQPESREVRHILVKQKALADEIYAKLKNGADFAELAERYSEDTASKAEGGKFKAFKGKTVAPFDKFVFAADTGDLSKPIKTEFGWHVIEVLEDIKPPSAQPLSEVRDSINSTLLQEEQNKALQSWVADTKQKYDVVYAPGYAPAATTTQGANTGATTTG
jgi:parvulin-like peptidyl-prolyl isomerase